MIDVKKCPQCGRSMSARVKHCRQCGCTIAEAVMAVVNATAEKKQGGPNKTEIRYRETFIDPRSDVYRCLFEGLTIRLENGHKYTPDWIVVTGEGHIECHEVKGKRKHPSHNRAQLAWKQAQVEFPHWRFVWARLQENNTWKVEE